MGRELCRDGTKCFSEHLQNLGPCFELLFEIAHLFNIKPKTWYSVLQRYALYAMLQGLLFTLLLLLRVVSSQSQPSLPVPRLGVIRRPEPNNRSSISTNACCVHK